MWEAALPWERGFTANFGQAVVDPLSFKNLEGMEYFLRDSSPNYPSEETKRPVKLRLVRNKSGINLLPNRLVVMNPLDNFNSTLGYAAAADGECAYPVDEYLPATGVAPNDLFYVVTGGPAQVMLPAVSPDSVVPGDLLVVKFLTSNVTVLAGRAGKAVFPDSYASAADGLAIAAMVRNAFKSLSTMAAVNGLVKVQVPWTTAF
jgi:hypothetical protein